MEKLQKGDKRFEGKVKRYKAKLATQGIFANVSARTPNMSNQLHHAFFINYLLNLVQIDNEYFNPEYTEVDRVLDVAVQTEPSGEVCPIY